MFLASLIARIQAYFRFRDTVRELSRLSDRELDDLGLSRDRIVEVAARHSFA